MVVGVLSTTDTNVDDTFTYTLVGGGDKGLVFAERRRPPGGL